MKILLMQTETLQALKHAMEAQGEEIKRLKEELSKHNK
jgi:hypothetical protein